MQVNTLTMDKIPLEVYQIYYTISLSETNVLQ